MSDLETLQRLERRAGTYDESGRFNRYFNGEELPSQLGLSLPPEMRGLQMVLNWPRVVVGSIDERLDIEGFRLADSAEADGRLWDWWQRNNLDEEASLGHVEALVTGRAYVVIGIDETNPDAPLITVEPSNAMTIERDPRTKKITAALRLYSAEPYGQSTHATLYTPDATRYYRFTRGRWVSDPEVDDFEHELGEVLVVALVNRARLSDRHGRSEISDVTNLTDAACRTLTNLQAAQELLAVPQRVLLGVTEEDFRDQATGELVSESESYLGRILALQNENAKALEFSSAQLETFTNTVMFYARQVSSMSGVPLRYLGIAGDVNGSSGDAIREDDTKLVKRAERISRNFSGSWEQAMRLAVRLIDGTPREDMDRLEVIWRDPSTPTVAAKADSAVKLYTANSASEGPLLPREAVWEELGYGPERRRELAGKFATDPLSEILKMAGPEDESDQLLPGDASTGGGGGAGLVAQTRAGVGPAGNGTHPQAAG